MASRPCPYVGCRYNLYLDVRPDTGSITYNFPDLEIHEMEKSCALDVADGPGEILEEVGDLMNVTRERARQIQAKACSKLVKSGAIDELAAAFFIKGERDV